MTRSSGTLLLRELVRDHRRLLTGGMLAGLVWQLCVAAVPVVLGATVEGGIVDGNTSALWWGGALLVVLGLATALTDALRHRWETTTGASVQTRLRERLATAALNADEAGRDQWPAAEVIARATGDADAISQATESLSYLVAHAVVIPVVIGVLVAIDPVLAVTVVATVILTVTMTWRASAAWERHTTAAQEAMAAYVTDAHAVMEGFKVIRCAGAEAGVLLGAGRRSAEVRDRTIRTARLWVVFAPVVEVLSGIAAIAVLWVGGERAISGALSLGDVVTATGLALVLIEPMSSVGYGVVAIRQALVSARRIASITRVSDVHPAHARLGATVASAMPAVLEAHNVHFSYPTLRDVTVVKGVDLKIRAGQVAFLAGPVGAGKSTLAALLAGDRTPTTGTIEWRGHALEEWAPEVRRRALIRVGPVPFLLAASVAENLRLGAPDATDEDLLAALDIAHGREIVDELTLGLDTVLADRGASLSGGQRQRLALARAVLAKPEVLVLDGATSGLEPTRELALLTGLKENWRHGILVIVSANPLLAALADVTVELAAPSWHAARDAPPAGGLA